MITGIFYTSILLLVTCYICHYYYKHYMADDKLLASTFYPTKYYAFAFIIAIVVTVFCEISMSTFPTGNEPPITKIINYINELL